MPPQVGKSGLLSKMGQALVDAHAEHRDDAPNFGQVSLPAGIENGIAQLIECHVGEYKEGPNKGQAFFMASGAVKRPLEKDGVTLLGMRTSIGPEPLCNTPQASGQRKTFSDHFGWVKNQVAILAGLPKIDLGNTPEEIEANFLALISTLTKVKPHFKFRTWKGKKQEIEERDGKFYVGTKGPYASADMAKQANPYVGQEPRVTQEWNGACDFIDDTDGSEGMEDSTAASKPVPLTPTTPPRTPQPNGEAKASAAPPRREAPARTTRDQTERMTTHRPTATHTVPTTSPAPSLPFDDMGDIDSLISRAEAQDEDAQKRLTEYAIKAGHTQDDVDNADNWTSVVALGTGATDEEATTTTTGPSFDWPVVNGEYRYTPIDKKTNKPGKSSYACEVIGIDHASRTATLKNLDDPKKGPYRSVPWDSLQVPVS